MILRDETYDLSLLEASRQKWDKSRALRLIYADIFSDLGKLAKPGKSLEVGSGIGVMKETLPGVVTSDLEKTQYVDERVSCYEIGESGRRWENILAVDVLHHLRFPMRFFESAAGALAPGGRLILNEPAATPGGRLFFRVCHHEPCRPGNLAPPFELSADDEEGKFANMGMGIALFVEHREWVREKLEECGLRVVRMDYRDLLAYPASGGFSKPPLLPAGMLKRLLFLEKRIPRPVLRAVALRMTLVLEKAT